MRSKGEDDECAFECGLGSRTELRGTREDLVGKTQRSKNDPAVLRMKAVVEKMREGGREGGWEGGRVGTD